MSQHHWLQHSWSPGRGKLQEGFVCDQAIGHPTPSASQLSPGPRGSPPPPSSKPRQRPPLPQLIDRPCSYSWEPGFRAQPGQRGLSLQQPIGARRQGAGEGRGQALRSRVECRWAPARSGGAASSSYLPAVNRGAPEVVSSRPSLPLPQINADWTDRCEGESTGVGGFPPGDPHGSSGPLKQRPLLATAHLRSPGLGGRDDWELGTYPTPRPFWVARMEFWWRRWTPCPWLLSELHKPTPSALSLFPLIGAPSFLISKSCLWRKGWRGERTGKYSRKSGARSRDSTILCSILCTKKKKKIWFSFPTPTNLFLCVMDVMLSLLARHS